MVKIVEKRLERAEVELSLVKELEEQQVELQTVSKKAKAFDVRNASSSEKQRLYDWKERGMASLLSDRKGKEAVIKSRTSSAVATIIGGDGQSRVYDVRHLSKGERRVEDKSTPICLG